MTYLRNKPSIVSEDCILCGKCYTVCPHEAKHVKSDLEKVKQWLKDGEEVVLSIAPSFATVWVELEGLIDLLKAHGFKHVEETAKGASVVSMAYANLMEEHKMDNIITTCCPVVTNYVERYYGDLVKYLAPVESPMIVSGKLIKQSYPKSKVVFLSPCIAKYKEMEDARFAGSIDAVITMEELCSYIEVNLKETEMNKWEDFVGSIARLYPLPGGILKTLEPNEHYKFAMVDGIERVGKMLDAMREGRLKGYFFEASSCVGSCMNGPLLAHFKHNEWFAQSILSEQVKDCAKITSGELPFDISTTWSKKELPVVKHSEQEIAECLMEMGKTSVDQMHNCGACGYETCRLKAIAVLDGKADPKICLPHALEQAKSLSSIILHNTPNGIVVLNEDLIIEEMNPASRRMVGYEVENPTGMHITTVLHDEALARMIESTKEEKPEFLRIYYKDLKTLMDHAIVYVPSQHFYVLILMDRTNEYHRETQMKQMRETTMQVTQEVIDEQMRTVQEIASLLGETTARSKVALTKLKLLMDEVGQLPTT